MRRYQPRCAQVIAAAFAGCVVLVVGTLLAVPAVDALLMSIDRARPLAGYAEALHDPQLAAAVWATVAYVAITLPLQLILGVAAALHVYLARHPLLWFSVYFMPYAIPVYAGVIAWRWMLDRHGFAAGALAALGIAPEAWFGRYALVTLCVVSIWQFYPFVFAAVLARLHKISPGLHATAAVDRLGIHNWLGTVVWPQIRGAVVASAVLRLAFMAAKFDVPWLLIGSNAISHGRVYTVFVAERVGTDPRGGVGLAASILLALTLVMVFAAASPLLRAYTQEVSRDA
ncbi:MAG TPA: sugar ABC transporter permease [Thermoanaerobaculia bacterium]|jgi:multiple sugar transport system permease protein